MGGKGGEGMLPAFFIGHGAPTIAVEDSAYTRFLKHLGKTLPRPRAAVVIDAHWESAVQQIGAAEKYETIYDFYGFPEELYRLRYPARGDLALAQEIQREWAKAGVVAHLDLVRGLDHGAWVPLRLLYPEADVPVVVLSVHPHLPPREQYALGKALSFLRHKDILVFGSGGTVHHLGKMDPYATAGAPWAEQFEQWLEDTVVSWDLENLFRYREVAPYASWAVPTAEHFVPLLVTMGTADEQRTAKKWRHDFQFGSVSLTVWQFGGE